jgi:hypothetical protein
VFAAAAVAALPPPFSGSLGLVWKRGGAQMRDRVGRRRKAKRKGGGGRRERHGDQKSSPYGEEASRGDELELQCFSSLTDEGGTRDEGERRRGEMREDGVHVQQRRQERERECVCVCVCSVKKKKRGRRWW